MEYISLYENFREDLNKTKEILKYAMAWFNRFKKEYTFTEQSDFSFSVDSKDRAINISYKDPYTFIVTVANHNNKEVKGSYIITDSFDDIHDYLDQVIGW